MQLSELNLDRNLYKEGQETSTQDADVASAELTDISNSGVASGDTTFDMNTNARAFMEGQTGYDTGKGFFMGYSNGFYKMSIGDFAGSKLLWDGTNLIITGTIYATAGSIGGWSIAPTYIFYDGATDITSAGMSATDYPFYAGKKYVDRATAPFRVTPAGIVYMTGAVIDGTSTLGGRTGSIIAGAIDSAGHFTDLTLNTSTKTILDAFTFGASGALQIGTYSFGVSGDVRISPNGIVGRNSANQTTFSIDGTTGNAAFTGTVNATAGYFGGAVNGVQVDSTGLLITSTGHIATGLTGRRIEIVKALGAFSDGIFMFDTGGTQTARISPEGGYLIELNPRDQGVTNAGIIIGSDNALYTGPMIAFDNDGSGYEMLGTGSTWNISKTGVANFSSVSGYGSNIRTFTAGEALTSGKAVYMSGGAGPSIFTISSTADATSGPVGYIGQTITSFATEVTEIEFVFYNKNNVSANVSIYRTSGGLPTGSAIWNSNYAVGDTGGAVTTTRNPTSVTTYVGEVLAVIFTNFGGGINGEGLPYTTNSDVYSYGNKITSSDAGVTWTADAGKEITLAHFHATPTTQGKIYHTNAQNSSVPECYANFIGVVLESGVANASVRVGTGGEFSIFGTLASGAGNICYVSNTVGIISNTAGTNSKKVGLSTGASSLIISYTT